MDFDELERLFYLGISDEEIAAKMGYTVKYILRSRQRLKLSRRTLAAMETELQIIPYIGKLSAKELSQHVNKSKRHVNKIIKKYK